MAAWFKGLFLGVGILLGLAEPREPPQMTMLLYRDTASLYASVELTSLPGKALGELVDASYAIRLFALIRAEPFQATVWHRISFDGVQYAVELSETGTIHHTDSAEAAWIMASRFIGVRLGETEGFSEPVVVMASVALAMAEEGSGDDPMVLWGYRPATAYRQLDSLKMVPYH